MKKYQKNEINKQRDFLEGMSAFRNAHGPGDADALLNYAKKKTGLSFNNHGARWTANRNEVACHYSWESHSFFDDGGGAEGHKDWSIRYVGATGNYPLRNNKLDDHSTYMLGTHLPAVNDSFYCENPFGFSGIYRICFKGDENNTD